MKNETEKEKMKRQEAAASGMESRLQNLLLEFYEEDRETCCIMIEIFVERWIEEKLKIDLQYIEAMIEKANSGRVH